MRRGATWIGGWGIALLAVSCGTGTFDCTDDTQCAGGGGHCAAPGFCAFPDAECVSGFSYAEFAAEGLAGQCVPAEGTGGTDAVGSTSGTATSTGTGSSGGTTLAVDDSGGGTTSSTSGTTPTTDASDGTDAVTTQTSTETGVGVQTLEFPASFAGCVLLLGTTPDPAGCGAYAGPGGMTVDLEVVNGMRSPAAAVLSIPIGPELGGAQILEARLRLHVLPGGGSRSGQSGELWLVSAFTPMSLETTLPDPLGDAPIAADLGPSTVDTDNVWMLPTDVLVADDVLYVGVYPLINDGVDYFTHEGAAPPVLEVDVQP